MKILRKHTSWIHTHFVTDGERISYPREKDILRQMDRVLKENRIVFGMHFLAEREERGVTIVLECIPLPQTMETIEHELARIIEPIPAKPSQTKVEIAPPHRRRKQ